ncbi:MAG: 1-acyl-sn-glycerol-3-phosphate acyltransferase [Actinomycetota bacterium]|nr:1-acyl-sn-glycerol-3-phosphate acyltransferase [Actinomycetota bacterium]
MPPPWVRRPVTVALWLTVSIVCVTLSPLILVLGELAARLIGRSQPAILSRLIVAYFSRELAAIVACGGLWLASGGGARIGTRRFQLLHWRLLGWFVHGLAQPLAAVLAVTVHEEPSPDAIRALSSDRPLILLSRHAGPGDTLFLADQLLSRYGRRPSIVFKQTLAFDPTIDLIAHRLPHVVVDPADADGSEARIQSVCSQLENRGVLLLFPEGGNFTPERRRKALQSLSRKGERRVARQAQRMSHVLPPRPSGVQAALRGNPSAPVIFAAHTGLGLATRPFELWRCAPIGKTFHTRMWLVPPDDIPTDPEEQIRWLNDWWARVDRWIDEHRTEPRFD